MSETLVPLPCQRYDLDSSPAAVFCHRGDTPSHRQHMTQYNDTALYGFIAEQFYFTFYHIQNDGENIYFRLEGYSRGFNRILHSDIVISDIISLIC